LHPDRVVIGAASAEGVERLALIYTPLDAPIVAVDRRSAELAKYTANALLAARISFMNEISHIAMAVNADVDDVARIVGMDRRIGPAFLRSGLGWGGSCFPKDVLALTSTAALNGCHTPILRAVYEINQLQAKHTAKLLLDAVSGIEEPVVAILGLAFKPNTDDVRGSPALGIARQLLAEGVIVRAHDPFALINASRVLPDVQYHEDAYSALDGADAVLLATEWEEYCSLDWVLVRESMRGKTVVDGRNSLNRVLLNELGFCYWSFGRAIHTNGNAAMAHLDASASSLDGQEAVTE
jgi:UDPglucose 6-dehydrogenase